ncbi:MAG: SHOCT domain-containing protein [Elusimicrobiales bacterium]|nr:SHOCT domain-containing protein [Elusimicrobiales bacterium]
MSGYGFAGVIMWVLFLIVMVAVLYTAVRVAGIGGGGAPGETALEILKKRYARGDIDKEEFERLKKDLG